MEVRIDGVVRGNRRGQRAGQRRNIGIVEARVIEHITLLLDAVVANGLDDVWYAGGGAERAGYGKAVVEPAVAGADYGLRRVVALLARAPCKSQPRSPIGVIVDPVLAFKTNAQSDHEVWLNPPIVLKERRAADT